LLRDSTTRESLGKLLRMNTRALRLLTLSFVVVTLAGTAACPPSPPPVISEGEGEGEGEAGEGEGEGEECLTVTLGPVVFNFQDDVSTHYQADIISDFDGVARDYLVLQFFNYNERIGDLGIGTFPLDDATNDNYGHCAECLMVFADQLSDGTAPQRVFFQSEGSITTERNPREGGDLFGSINDLVLVESTIGGDALESEPVPGGDCLIIGDVELDVKFVPPGWTCDPALYNAKDGVCNCDCGELDTDCFPNFDDPPPTSTEGCEADEVCTVFGCRVACDAFAGEGCEGENGVCTFADPSDYCEDNAAIIDPADVGEDCTADFTRLWCAVVDTIPGGVCDFDLDGDNVRVCRPRCETIDDCEAGEICFNVQGGGGFCGPES
jgi:hypothetical protein